LIVGNPTINATCLRHAGLMALNGTATVSENSVWDPSWLNVAAFSWLTPALRLKTTFPTDAWSTAWHPVGWTVAAFLW
jgi:hypothetical protein